MVTSACLPAMPPCTGYQTSRPTSSICKIGMSVGPSQEDFFCENRMIIRKTFTQYAHEAHTGKASADAVINAVLSVYIP